MYLIGQAIDFHQISKIKPLILGGIKIKEENSLKAFSDGDIILHVISEAIFGALQKGDLGTFFPSDNPLFKNISSIKILNKALNFLQEEKYEIVNIDLTFISEEIIISKYRERIINNLKKILNCGKISLKGTTSDNFLSSQKKYVICQGVILLRKI